MTILDYYKSSQLNEKWYKKFQSTSANQSGTVFSYVTTNFRYLKSFISQFKEFRSKIGVERDSWTDKLPCGQELDKHRITELKNFGLITTEQNYYTITSKGLAISDLIDECENNKSINESTKNFLLLMLILDYHTESIKFDIVKTVKKIYSALEACDYAKCDIESMVINSLKISKKANLFKSDIFWLITFYKDPDFIRLFKNSSEEETINLKNYLNMQSKVNDSTDCIAHKFKSGGSYSVPMFMDNLRTLFFVSMILKFTDLEFESLLEVMLSKYCDIYDGTDKRFVMSFVNNHKSIFKKVYLNFKQGGF